MRVQIAIVAASLSLVPSLSMAQDTSQPRYIVENGGIAAHGPVRYYGNRPLYGNNSDSFVLGGDRPLIRYARGQYVYGTFLAALVRGNNTGKWLHLADDIKSTYQSGYLTWVVRDASFAGSTVTLRAVPMAGTSGMAIQFQVEGAQAGDRLIWAYGGSRRIVRASEDLDVMGHPDLLMKAFAPEDAADNDARIIDDGFDLRVSAATSLGKCNVPTRLGVGSAAAIISPTALVGSSAQAQPIVWGVISSEHLKEVYCAVQGLTDSEGAAIAEAFPQIVPAEAFAAASRHQEAIANQIQLSTPDPHLNAMAAAAAIAVDGAWYPPVFVHGAMSWNAPFVGWRTLFGGTAFGWHGRVKEMGRHYIETQVRESDRRLARADPATLLTAQHPESRLYGVGSIAEGQYIYDMQSQFFDQLVHSWRWTADPELEAFLRPALTLHLQWLQECFDPDEDGTYESYINSFPTDSVWYNGGGSVEASMYAYRGHAAARDMARRAHDSRSTEYHTRMLERIRKGFFEKLWIQRKGHAGAYREQGGHQRLHEDAWLYSIFLPIDAGTLLSTEQAAQSLRYTEAMLQNERMPLGGRTVYASNWVPGIWSVRENYPGDNYHLALAYFQTGMAEDGWDLFRGTFLQSAFGSRVPGNLGAPVGTDFGDCVHMFARALVEGLFGYSPDYPNNRVSVSPHFPAEWNRASIKTPDAAIRFERTAGTDTLHVELTRAAPIDLNVPVRAQQVAAVKVDGRRVPFQLLPGFGQTVVQVRLPARSEATLTVMTRDPLPQFAAISMEGSVGEAISLRADQAKIVSFDDSQGALSGAAVRRGIIEATLAANPGHHTVMARVEIGGVPQFRLFHVKITDPAADAAQRRKTVEAIPADARWEPLDVSASFNGDIRTIFQQQYLSPRPNTVSARIGTDGYSPWTFPYWKSTPPRLSLDNVQNLLDSSRGLVTPQGVPFAWNVATALTRNVAFTSLWDNWPHRITVPVNKKGEAIFLLIGGSTNVMQCHIANAVVKLHYADGQDDELALIPPINYWNLSPIAAKAGAPGQPSRTDYTDPIDAFVVPKPYPQTVQLGENVRAMLLNRRLRSGVSLQSVTLEALSQEVVVGLMGLTVMNAAAGR